MARKPPAAAKKSSAPKGEKAATPLARPSIEIKVDTTKTAAATDEQIDRLLAHVKNLVFTWAKADHGEPAPRVILNHEGNQGPADEED
jgi:hypothetical protein